MSRLIDIDFVHKNPFSLSNITKIALCCILFSMVLMGWGILKYVEMREKLEVTQSKLNSRPNKVVVKSVTKTSERVSESDIRQAETLLEQLSAPWQPLLNALDQVNSKDIALLSIEPNKKKQQVLLTGQARNMEATLAYVRRLMQESVFTQVYLLKHSVDFDHPFEPVEFSIVAEWKS